MCAVKPIEITVTQHQGAALVTVSGHVTASDTDRLSAALENLIASKADLVIVDLRGVDLITSDGLGALIRARKALTDYGARLALTGLTGNVLDVFTMTRLDKVFSMYDSPDTALAAGPLG